MSRIDDRIRARLQMQIVLRGIAVLLFAAGAVVCLLWIVSPIFEAAFGWGRPSNSPSLCFMLRNTIGMAALGVSLILPGIALLKGCDWLSELWVPLKPDGGLGERGESHADANTVSE